MNSKKADFACRRVGQTWRQMSSILSVAKKLSATEISQYVPGRPTLWRTYERRVARRTRYWCIECRDHSRFHAFDCQLGQLGRGRRDAAGAAVHLSAKNFSVAIAMPSS